MLADLFRDHPDKRIIVTCFASHIHRIQQVAEAAIAEGRIVATLGRSMAKNVALARKMGLLNIADDQIVDIEDVRDIDGRRVCVISTGSQGEPLSALALMAAGENKWLKVGPRRPGGAEFARHPGQRGECGQGHRRPAPPRR